MSQSLLAGISDRGLVGDSDRGLVGDGSGCRRRGLAGDRGRGLAGDNVRRRCRRLAGDGGRGLAGESGRCRRQGRSRLGSGLARDHGGRNSTLFLDTETFVQPEPFIEGLEPHPAVDVLDTRCRATLTVTYVPRPDLTTSGTHPSQLGVRGRCYRLWSTRSFGWFGQFARFSECTQSRARREGC